MVYLFAFKKTFRLYIPEVVSSLSGHWSTNQPLDRELVEKLCTVPRQLLAGYDLCNELFLAAYDINFYTVDWGQEQYQVRILLSPV